MKSLECNNKNKKKKKVLGLKRWQFYLGLKSRKGGRRENCKNFHLPSITAQITRGNPGSGGVEGKR